MNIFHYSALLCISIGLYAQPLKDWLGQAQSRLVTEVLPNGLTVMCYPMPGQTEVHVEVTYNVGSKDELPHEHGYAHMVEHMIFKGTKKMSEGDLDAIADTFLVGPGGYNAVTSKDRTRYFFRTDKNNYPVFLDILADCMFNVQFDENHVASEVKAVIGEINDRRDALGAILYEKLDKMMFPKNHPYHHEICGEKKSLLPVTSSALRDFYARHYTPQQALLTIVGDVDVTQALRYARTSFSRTVAPVEKKKSVSLPIGHSARKETIQWPIPHHVVSYAWKLPFESVSRAVLRATTHILSARLTDLLVVHTGLAYSCDVDHLFIQEVGQIYVHIRPKNGDAIHHIKRLVKEVLHECGQQGPTQDEVRDVKLAIESSQYAQFKDCAAITHEMQDDFLLSKGDVSRILQGNMAIDAEKIRTLVRDFLTPKKRFTLIAEPFTEEERAQWYQKQGEEDVKEQALLNSRMRHTDLDSLCYAHDLPEPAFIRHTYGKPDKVLTLSNGLTVYIKQQQGQPFVAGNICFKQADQFSLYCEQQGLQWVQLLSMTISLYGTIHESCDALARMFDQHHVERSATASAVSFTCPYESFGLIGKKMASIMRCPLYSELQIAFTIKKMQENLLDEHKDLAYYADQHLRRALLRDYTWMTTEEEACNLLAQITRDDLVGFHNMYINPSNMILTLVGPVDLATIEATLEQSFGAWRDTKSCQSVSAKVPHQVTVPHRVVEPHQIAKDRNQVLLCVGRKLECFTSKQHMCLMALYDFVYRKLYAIRERTGLFYDIRLSLYNPSSCLNDIASLCVSINPAQRAQVAKEIRQVMKEVALHGIPEGALQNAKNAHHLQLAKNDASVGVLAQEYSKIYGTYESVKQYQGFLDALTLLTKKDVDEVAREFFNPDSWSVVTVGRVDA